LSASRTSLAEINFAINELRVDQLDASQRNQIWKRINLSCSKPLPLSFRKNADTFQQYSFEVTRDCLELLLELLPLVSVDEAFEQNALGHPEGQKSRIEINEYGRDRRNRLACIKHHGTACKVCGLEFESIYGEIGTGFIEVHHIRPVSQIGQESPIDPINDLVPLCSNCHSMAHRGRHGQLPRSPQELRDSRIGYNEPPASSYIDLNEDPEISK
jgi:5-methylcytosine-specific restriction protein A